MRTFMIWTFLAALAAPAWANNNYFLPGDAYFPTELTTGMLKQLQDQKKQEYVFHYSSFGGYEEAFCGYAGYRHALIEEVGKAFLDNLKNASDHVRASKVKPRISRTKGKSKASGIQVLFVPEAFDVTKFKLGVRYNEDWVDEVIKFGHGHDQIRLCELLDEAEVLEKSWRDSRRVGSFELTLPPETAINPAQAVDAPVTIKGAVKAIVLHPGTLASYFKPQEGDVMRVVDSKGLITYRLEKWKWVEFESPQP